MPCEMKRSSRLLGCHGREKSIRNASNMLRLLTPMGLNTQPFRSSYIHNISQLRFRLWHICNHPPEKSSTLSKFLGFCLVSLALLDRNMAPLAKLQESLTHDHILSAFLGIYMAPTCTYTIMFIHLLPFCVSQFSIYLSQYFSRSF